MLPLLLLLLLASTPFLAESEKVSWTYADLATWDSPQYECNKGTKQSPVDISAAASLPGQERNRMQMSCSALHLKPESLVLQNKQVSLVATGAGGEALPCTLASKGAGKATLLQFHFHSPSEHRINGKAADLEAHFVHKSELDGSLHVLGLLFDAATNSPPDPFLEAVIGGGLPQPPLKTVQATQDAPYTPRVSEGLRDVPVGIAVRAGNMAHHVYSGSLTTPPCTEGVTHYVVEEVHAMSQKQLDAFRKAFSRVDTARSPQPLNDRHVTFYRDLRNSPGAALPSSRSSCSCVSVALTSVLLSAVAARLFFFFLGRRRGVQREPLARRSASTQEVELGSIDSSEN